MYCYLWERIKYIVYINRNIKKVDTTKEEKNKNVCNCFYHYLSIIICAYKSEWPITIYKNISNPHLITIILKIYITDILNMI